MGLVGGCARPTATAQPETPQPPAIWLRWTSAWAATMRGDRRLQIDP
ncbi:MAG TPA: hypothetical protein VMV29_05280 [Ktedonobacterales bacterium]|nr:hypothetical protein [Ktedonobacterales bacterium]